MLEKMGPCRVENSPVLGLYISVPIKSAGSRSGVNWIREKGSDSAAARDRTVNVLQGQVRLREEYAHRQVNQSSAD